MTMSQISVVIPCYNSAHLIVDAINSVISQTYTNWEIVIVDDGSTDDLKTAISAFTNRAIQLIRQTNSGPSVARNRGIKNAHGEYIAFLDADDIWLPEKLEKQVRILECRKDYGLVFCDGYRWIHRKPFEACNKLSQLYATPNEHPTLEKLFKIHMIPTSSVLFRKSLIERCGLINEQLKGGEDFEFFLRIAAIRSINYLDEPLMAYRVHSNNTSSVVLKNNVRERIWMKLNARHVAIQSNPELKKIRSIRFFKALPIWLQYYMLLFWRIRYGNSMKHLSFSIGNYAKKLIQPKR